MIQEITLHMDITRWSILKSDWLYLAAKDGEALCSQQNIRPRAECGWDHELLIEKFRFKLNKGGKTTRPYRYDLKEIPYNYTMEVINRFKGLDLIGAWRTMDGGSWHCTGGRNQDHPQEKEMQKGKMVVWGGLTNSCKEKQKENEKSKDTPFWIQSSKEYQWEIRKPSSVISAKK